MKRFTLILITLLLQLSVWGQQNIKGTVLDSQSEISLIGVSVIIENSDPLIGTVTDINGNFILADVPIGRYNLVFSYVGYESATIPNVEINSGKELFLDVQLTEDIEQLNEVVITYERSKDVTINEMATVSARSFSIEEVNRYSGGRSDVARLASNFAGVSTSDDSRNDIVIRGNSPTGVLWRLEGVPIPNPNHFSTSGTTGGPVSAMNPNMIKNSDFLTSAFPAEYGNANAGVFDIGFRNGNRDKNEYMAQFGIFTGFEAMAEGPINKESKGSYLIAARYSFTGAAAALGLPIGTNATPNYQDVAFIINLGQGKAGKFGLFGIGGNSTIDFLHDEVDEEDLFAAVDEDAYVVSNFGVAGIKHKIFVDDKTYIRSVLSFSSSGNEFLLDRYTDLNLSSESVKRVTDVDNRENRLSLSTFANRKFNSRFTMRAGLLVENYTFNLSTRNREFTPDWITIVDFNDATFLNQAYVQGQYKFTKKWTLNLGIHSQILTLNNNMDIGPRMAVNYHLNPKNTFSFGYGWHAQVAPLPILLAKEEVASGVFEETNVDLDATRSQHFVLSYDSKFAKDWRLKTEVYYQYIDKVPVESTPSSFSLLNEGADFGFSDDKVSLKNEGTGYNRGIELTIEKFFSQGFYGLFTSSIYESKYEGSDQIERNSAFNNQYVLNLLTGREIKFGKDKRNAFTIDTKFTTAGGRYYTPVDLEASKLAGEEILRDDVAFSEQYNPYLRFDIKFGVKLNNNDKKISHQLYFDIQNVTNNQNIFANRYNRLNNEVNTVYQSGFFPDFMYRIMF